MLKMLPKVASLLFMCVSLCSAAFVNLNVTRKVDISTAVVKITAVLIVENRDYERRNVYTFKLDPGVYDFHAEFSSELGEKLRHAKEYDRNGQNFSLKVHLNKKLKHEEAYKMHAEIYYLNRIKPAFKKKPFNETQQVLYVGNTNFFSPYETLFCRSLFIKTSKPFKTLEVPSSDVDVYSYEDVKPFTYSEKEFVFENNNRLLKVTSLERAIDVSHFGKITVEDKITLENTGSKIAGPFEPKLYEVHRSEKNWLHTHLPASAENVRFFDSIGLLSKHQMLDFEDYQTFKFQVRYPLIGGWKAPYHLRYTVPMHEYLKSDMRGQFLLQIRAVDHILNDVVVERAMVKILLPEGADVKSVVNLPSGINRLKDEVEFTSLTYFGRPTIVLKGRNLLEMHIEPISIYYKFSNVTLFRVPILVTIYIEIIFLSIILYRRCNFGLK